MNKISVLKFGGTSVKNVARINHVADIIEKDKVAKRIVVVSAMGDTTDYLYKLAKQCSGAPDKREIDLLLSTGEQISIALLALVLKDRGIRAKSFTGAQIGIRTDSIHSSARIVDISTNALRAALREYDVVVVAGFQGLSDTGEITTLGRGGSDTSAVALAAAVGADECHIYTDVDGIYTSDPNQLKNTRLLNSISYLEAIELARSGAQVIHPRAAELAKQYGIKLRVRNTFKPENIGTLVSGGKKMEKICSVKAVALDSHQAYVLLTNMPTTFDYLSESERLLARENISIDVVSQTFVDTEKCFVQFALRYPDADLLHSVLDELKAISRAEDCTVDLNVTRVSLIGQGISSSTEIRARALARLKTGCVPIRLFSNNETSISFLVDTQCARHAAEVLHQEFVRHSDTSARLAAFG